MAFIERAIQGYHYIFDELSDPRTKDWWLISGPGPLLTILATYIYFCVKAGPQYMKEKKPYSLKNAVMVYNVVQILISLYLVYNIIMFLLTEGYGFQCKDVDYSNSPAAMTWARGVWLYFFSKITELLDTVFFVLRKKDKQITFLHMYHHTIMPIIGWLGTKYAAGGQAVIEGSINSVIHVIMYSYYLISGLGPEYQKYLWWKKYLTSMQLIQFCIIVSMSTNCWQSPTTNYPKFLSGIVLVNCVAFFYMFGMFYYNNYVKSKKERTT